MRFLKAAILWCLSKLRRLTAGPYAVATLARSQNGLLLVPVEDARVGRRLCFNGGYDPELLDLLMRRCADTSRVLFLGAHVGALAIPMAKHVRKVVAVEADPVTFDLLQANVSLNASRNIEAHCFAAGDKNASVGFLSTRRHTGGNHLQKSQSDRAPRALLEKPRKISVQMKRLDDVFQACVFEWIVMDVEGAEPLALRGMSTLLRGCKGLLTEVSERQLRQVAGVGVEEILPLIEPHFDEALFLPEKPRKGQFASRLYSRANFAEMFRDCSKFRVANVMLWKGTITS